MLERDVEALANGVLVEGLVEPEGEDEVLGPGAVVATAEAVQDDGDLVGHGDAAHALGLRGAVGVADVVAPHVHDAVGEVDVEPAEGAQLAHAQAGEGGGDVDRAVELGAVGARDGVDLVGGEDREVAGALDGDALGVVGGVGGDPALALGALEDRVFGLSIAWARLDSNQDLTDYESAKSRKFWLTRAKYGASSSG